MRCGVRELLFGGGWDSWLSIKTEGIFGSRSLQGIVTYLRLMGFRSFSAGGVVVLLLKVGSKFIK